jgi:hypothetical protein
MQSALSTNGAGTSALKCSLRSDNMRDGFREIVSGWTLVDDFDKLTERIECSAEWAKANTPLGPDEAATARMMAEAQIVRGIKRGDFEPHIGRDQADDVARFLTGAPRVVSQFEFFRLNP